MLISKVLLYSKTQSLDIIKAFFQVPLTVFTVNCILFLQLSCSERLCEGKGPNLRKDDTFGQIGSIIYLRARYFQFLFLTYKFAEPPHQLTVPEKYFNYIPGT